jgi:hypothetical protein
VSLSSRVLRRVEYGARRLAADAPSPKRAQAGLRIDPLQNTAAKGTVFEPVSTWRLSRKIKRALELGADVPPRVQDGPTCGLYALGMVMDFWGVQRPDASVALVQAEDAARGNSHTVRLTTNDFLLDVARNNGFTKDGEMFNAHQLAALARQFGYQASVKSDIRLEDIHQALERKHPPLVAFDVDKNGNPGLFGGKRAHWAVVEGAFQNDGIEYLVASHGWTGKDYTWRADDLLASMGQLERADLDVFPHVAEDISSTLKSKLLEIF